MRPLATLAISLFVNIVSCNPGDFIVKANFRKEAWRIYSVKSTQTSKLELDARQNAIKLADEGSNVWWFETPLDYFRKDSGLAYNGTIVFHLQSLHWSGTFVSDYDVVLVSRNKKFSVGVKGIRRDGDTSKEYIVSISPEAGWQMIDLKHRTADGKIQVNASKLDLINCLNTLDSIRIRGGYYSGNEKTQVRAFNVIQGAMSGDESTIKSANSCCSSRQHSCTSDLTFDLVFNNPGVACTQMSNLHTGKLAVGDTTGAFLSVVLDQAASSPIHDFYVNKQLSVTATGSVGPITNYLGLLSWEGTTGVSSVTIQNGGSGCQSGGYLSDVGGGGGSGFAGSFMVGFSFPSISVNAGGGGCTGAVRESITITVAGGVVTGLALAASVTSTSYLSNAANPLGNQAVPAVVTCLYPCSGSGLSATCTVTGGDVTAVTLVSGGSGYSAINLPTVSCAEGYITASDNSNGTGFGNRVAEIVSVVSLTASGIGGIGTVAINGGTAGSTALDTIGITSNSYLHNAQATIICNPPCIGSGAVITCYTDTTTSSTIFNGDGDLKKVVVTSAGTGYSMLNPPQVICPEGGRNFLGFFSTDNAGAINTVNVPASYVGTGYGGTIRLIVQPAVSTCIGFQVTPVLSGTIHTVTILNNGQNYKYPPALTISGNGVGCTGTDLRAHIGDHTGDVLYAAGTTTTAILGLSASKVDNFYYDWTVVMISGNNAGQLKRIINYAAGSRTITVDSAFTSATAAGNAYALTTTPVRSLYDSSRAINFVSLATGLLPSATTANSNSIVLASSASTRDNFYKGQTIYFMNPRYAAYITSYNGATKTATVSVTATSIDGYDNEIPANTALPINTPYAISLSYVAHVQVTPTAATSAGQDYIIQYEDTGAKQKAHAQAKSFFCDQAVGDNPKGPLIQSPFRRTFAFQSVPYICSVATLTIAVEGQPFSDNLWFQGNNLTVFGEKNEVLGTVFADSELYKMAESGGPIVDSLTLSQEKMLEMTADGVFIFDLVTQKSATGAIRFRFMKLSFSPSACYVTKVGTDVYQVRNDTDRHIPSVYYNLTFNTPSGGAGRPASDGVIVVTADADFSNGYLELSYRDKVQEVLFSDWVWGSLATSYAMSQPADISTTCSGSGLYPSFSCTATDSSTFNGTRDGAHTTYHRIGRESLNYLRENGTAQISFKVVNSKAAKLSPIILGYTLMYCHMQSLTVGDGQIFGVSLFRPSIQLFSFPKEAPPAAGPAIIWVKAVIKGTGVFNKQSLGLPNQSPRIVMTDKGQYDLITNNVLVPNQDAEASLTTARDPALFYNTKPSRYPFMSALGLHAGNNGEFIDYLFSNDFSQYDVTKGYVDSVVIPLSIMQGFSLKKRLEFSFDVPPGADTIRVLSAVIAYPVDVMSE